MTRRLRMVRRHWAFVIVASLGATLRALAWAAYQPALFYPDSVNYLENTHRVPNVSWHPPGYAWLLDLLLIGHHLAVVTAVQHLLVIADAVLIYVLLQRLGAGRIVATLATAPLLLDAYQVQIEQYVLSEALFESLLAAAVAIALWPSREWRSTLSARRAGAVALLLGALVLVRIDALGLVVALVGWLVWWALRYGIVRSWRPIATAVVALALPLVALFGMRGVVVEGTPFSGMNAIWFYSRVATFADCAHDSIPANERSLCPTQPIGGRPGPIWFQDSPSAPEVQYLAIHHGDTATVKAFARRVVLHQPLDYLRAVDADFAEQFRPTRAQTPDGPEVRSWLFRDTLTPVDPSKPVPQTMVSAFGTGHARIDVGIARALGDYQRFGYLPGPVIALLALGSLVALVVRRRHPLAPGLLFVLLSAVMTVLVATATVLFSWRYMLPTLLLYPLAGAIAWTMVRSGSLSTTTSGTLEP
jgi:hypothetical protein